MKRKPNLLVLLDAWLDSGESESHSVDSEDWHSRILLNPNPIGYVIGCPHIHSPSYACPVLCPSPHLSLGTFYPPPDRTFFCDTEAELSKTAFERRRGRSANLRGVGRESGGDKDERGERVGKGSVTGDRGRQMYVSSLSCSSNSTILNLC